MVAIVNQKFYKLFMTNKLYTVALIYASMNFNVDATNYHCSM